MINPAKSKQNIGRYLLTLICLALVSCSTGMNEQQMLQNAKSYLSKQELMAASIELRNTLQKNRENAEARYLLGTIYMQIGDLPSAEKEFRRAELAGWDQQEIQTNIARIFITRKDFKKLLDEISIVNTWSADTQANIAAMRALAYAGLGNLVQAKTALEEGRKYSTDALYVLKTTVMFQLASVEQGDATATLQKALTLYPENSELLLLQASNRIQNDNLSQAAETFKKVISLDPPNLITANGRIAHIGLARLQIIDKNIEGANSTLARLLKRNDNDPDANYLAGLLALNQHNYDIAEEHIRKLLAISPDHIQSQQAMGKIKYALKNYDQAVHYLATYLNSNPDDVAVRKLLANTYIILNQPELAKSTLQGTTAVDPEDPEILTLLSQIEFNKGDLNTGIQFLSKAVKSSPDNIALHKQLAKAYISTGNMSQALAEIKTYHRLSNNTEETQKLGISAYLKSGQIDKAIIIVNQMLDKKPDDPELLSLNGGLYAAINNNQQARLYFNKALQLQDMLPTAIVGLARLEKKEGSYDKAIALYNSLVDANIGGTIPMLALSELAAEQNRTSDMLSWLEKARNAAPAEARPRIILANYYLSINDTDKANIYVQEALKTSPEQPDLLALQGRILIAQKRYQEAVPILKDLLTKIPDSSTVRTLLGEAYLRQGMTTNAREQLQKILDRENDNVIAITLMAETEFKEGHLDKSLEYTKLLQKTQPESYIGYLLEGNIWVSKADYNKAYTAFALAWKYQHTADLAIKLFMAAKHSMDFKAAIEPLTTWLNTHPNDSTTRFFLAMTYQNAEDNDSAIAEYETILKDKPDNAAVLNNLAWLYSLKNNPKALDYAEKAYRLTQTDPGILDTYGWLLVQQGQTMKGRRLLQQAMEQLPDNLEIRYHYAVALIHSDSKSEGQQILEKLLRENRPFIGRKDAQQLIAKLASADDM
ncbi:MAG: PEP-CTERM system TPR-repeat protein PrsT [Gammaproteobacteria bacterium]|nr:PEP-CTERM system TPR-repeat protein PrsT [Gammaproteobacteria bacterium]